MYQEWRTGERNYNSTIEFLTQLNISLTTDHNYRCNLDHALKRIGNYCKNDRIHIIRIHPDMTFTILYEWCCGTATPLKETTQKYPCFFAQELEDQLNSHNYIYIQDKEGLSCQELKEYLHKHGIENILLIPLFSGYSFSFIVFSQSLHSIPWTTEEIRMYHLLADIVAANMEKNTIIQKLIHRLRQRRHTQPSTATY